MTISMDDIRQLSVSERIQLVEDIWDTIAASQESVPMTNRQRQELDRRLDEYSRDPSAGRTWDAVREDLGHEA
jgi:putative addiction module component (TIGR02574 family)